MADNRDDRSREAGDRSRAQRLQAQRLRRRQEFWEVPDDPASRRAHRRSRARRTR